MSKEKGRLQELGCRISEAAADLSAHPYAQIGLVLVCAAWFLLALRVDILTAALSILAITLTQMVLNRQQERETDAHRRDVALHAKLDELLIASRRARDEMAGVEDLEEEQIEALRHSNGTASKLSAARKARRNPDRRPQPAVDAKPKSGRPRRRAS
jgi:low affinity Fe/Cu permease